MDKKWIAIILIGIIILLAVGLTAFDSFSNQKNEVKVGNAKFQVPDGYKIGKTGDDSATNLTNGTNEIYIMEYGTNHVEKYINAYVDKLAKNNKTVNISNFTVGKELVYKSNLNNPGNVHYWFVKDNNTYSIYSWDKNPKIDSITIKLIESIS